MAERKVQACRVSYYDDARSDDVVLVGAWEVVLAERKFGRADEHQMEYAMYLGYLGARRAGLVPDGVGFDAWGTEVALVEDADGEESPGESQTPPGT